MEDEIILIERFVDVEFPFEIVGEKKAKEEIIKRDLPLNKFEGTEKPSNK